jgi:hypothetical protein
MEDWHNDTANLSEHEKLQLEEQELKDRKPENEDIWGDSLT